MAGFFGFSGRKVFQVETSGESMSSLLTISDVGTVKQFAEGRQIVWWSQPVGNALGSSHQLGFNLDAPALPDRDWSGSGYVYSGGNGSQKISV